MVLTWPWPVTILAVKCVQIHDPFIWLIELGGIRFGYARGLQCMRRLQLMAHFCAYSQLRHESAFTLTMHPIAFFALARINTRTFDAGLTSSRPLARARARACLRPPEIFCASLGYNNSSAPAVGKRRKPPLFPFLASVRSMKLKLHP